MNTKKTEDGGGRFSVLHFDSDYKNLTITVTVSRGNPPERDTDVTYLARSEAIDVPYGKYESFSTNHLSYLRLSPNRIEGIY